MLPPDRLVARLLAGLAPGHAATAVEKVGDFVGDLFPEELAAVANCVPARRAEFATGRAGARRAMAALGVPPAPVPVGQGRAPRWPEGMVGSLSHSRGLCAAIVGRRHDIRAIGLDLEWLAPVPALSRFVRLMDPGSRVSEIPGHLLPVYLFSIYEAAFKACYVATGLAPSPDDFHLELNAGSGRFQAHARSDRLVSAMGTAPLTGRFAAAAGYVVSVACQDHRVLRRPPVSGHGMASRALGPRPSLLFADRDKAAARSREERR